MFKDFAQSRVGLCLDCAFGKRITSDRGATFFLCGRSLTDRHFPKYPRLPVLQCPGYSVSDITDDKATQFTWNKEGHL